MGGIEQHIDLQGLPLQPHPMLLCAVAEWLMGSSISEADGISNDDSLPAKLERWARLSNPLDVWPSKHASIPAARASADACCSRAWLCEIAGGVRED
jgi:hypothetical protein